MNPMSSGLTICGRIPSTLILNTDAMASEIKGLFYFELNDATRPDEGAEELSADGTVRGQFYRELEPLLTSDDPAIRERGERALRYGLAALSGENLTDF